MTFWKTTCKSILKMLKKMLFTSNNLIKVNNFHKLKLIFCKYSRILRRKFQSSCIECVYTVYCNKLLDFTKNSMFLTNLNLKHEKTAKLWSFNLMYSCNNLILGNKLGNVRNGHYGKTKFIQITRWVKGFIKQTFCKALKGLEQTF